MTAKTAPATPYEAIGGASAFSAIAERFYDIMDSEPSFSELRAMHGADLAPMRIALAQFLCGWAGGPRDWFDANPGRCMMSVHAALTISPTAAGQWAEAMGRAIAEADLQPPAMARNLAETLGAMARGMARTPRQAPALD